MRCMPLCPLDGRRRGLWQGCSKRCGLRLRRLACDGVVRGRPAASRLVAMLLPDNKSGPAVAPQGPSPPSNDPPGVITSESAGRRSDAYAVGARARAARPRVAPAPGTPALAPPGPAPAPEPPGPAVVAPPGPVSGPPAPGPPGAGAEGAVVVS